MKKAGLLAVCAIMLFALGSFGVKPTYAQGGEITVQLFEQNGSGENGTATLTEQNGQVMVTLNLTGAPSGVAQPAHIHEGTCADLNPTPKYPLTNVVNGSSTTTVPVTLAELTGNEAYAINVHKSASEVNVYVSCGDISILTSGPSSGGGSTPGMPSTGSSSEPLTLMGMMLIALAMVATGLRFWFAARR